MFIGTITFSSQTHLLTPICCKPEIGGTLAAATSGHSGLVSQVLNNQLFTALLSWLLFLKNCLCLFVGVLHLVWQHLRSHQDKYRLVVVHTHGDFIVLSHWDTKLMVP